MAIHRIAAGFRRQDWFAVVIEFASVLLGVLVGVQVSNLNEERRHQMQVRQVIGRLRPDFRDGVQQAPYIQRYFANREALGRRAEALWNQPGHDEEFFVSAYGTGSYAALPDFDTEENEMRIGRDTVSQIDDDDLRNAIAAALGLLGDEYMRFSYIDTDFRRTVRRIVPSDMQERYIDICNHPVKTAESLQRLYSEPCKLGVAPEITHKLAAEIRADSAALGQLREHINRMSTLNERLAYVEPSLKSALKEMDRTRR